MKEKSPLKKGDLKFSTGTLLYHFNFAIHSSIANACSIALPI